MGRGWGGDSKKALSINCYGATIKKGILMTELEQIIGYTFKNPELLKEGSYSFVLQNGKHLRSNERLEF